MANVRLQGASDNKATFYGTNPIFYLIKNDLAYFQEKMKIEIKKGKKNKKKYYLISYEKEDNVNFLFDNKFFEIVNFHVSVYEDVRKDEAKGKASYHLTLEVEELSSKNIYITHAYFDTNNKLIYINFTDPTGKITTLNDHFFDSKAYNYVMPFAKALETAFLKANDNATTIYSESLAQLETISRNLHTTQSYQNYLTVLEKLIDHVHYWQMFDFKKVYLPLNYLIHLQTVMQEKLDKLSETSIANGSSILPEEKSTLETSAEEQEKKSPSEIKNLRTQLQSLQKRHLSELQNLIFQYRLLNQLVDLSTNQNEILDSLLRIAKLQKTAYKELAKLIISGVPNGTDATDLEELIKIVPQLKHSDFTMAIRKQNNTLLKLMLQHHSYVNLNISDEKSTRTLTEEAFENKNTEALELLLNAGENPDNENALNVTLLMMAARMGRYAEMVALLKAGANPNIYNGFGYTALGFLCNNNQTPPSLTALKLFLDNAKGLDIDCMQGPTDQQGSVLAFACQTNRVEIVKLLLEYNANPMFCRETDFHSGLAIAVAKNFGELVEVILTNTKHDLTRILPSAIWVAQACQREEILNRLIKYIRDKEIQLPNELTYYIHASASSNTKERLSVYQSTGRLPQASEYQSFIISHNNQITRTKSLFDMEFNIHHITKSFFNRNKKAEQEGKQEKTAKTPKIK